MQQRKILKLPDSQFDYEAVKQKLIDDIFNIINSSWDNSFHNSEFDSSSLYELAEIGLKSMTLKELQNYFEKQKKIFKKNYGYDYDPTEFNGKDIPL
jgi:hypothetical protein